MNKQITFQSVDSLSPEVVNFWRIQQARQEPWKGLIGTPEWFLLMAGGSVKPAVVAVVRQDEGGVIALAPLLFQFMDLGMNVGPLFKPKKVLVARVCGGETVVGGQWSVGSTKTLNNDECEAQCSSSADTAASTQDPSVWLASLWSVIIRRDPDVQAIVLDHVDESRVPMMRASCGRGSGVFLYECSKLMPHYRLVLPASYEDFRKLRSASSLRKIEARERAMVREVGGECQVVEIRRPADWAPYAADINRLMNAAWQAVRLGHGFDIESCRQTAERGWLRSFLLLVGNKPASFVLGYQAPAAQGKGELLSCPVDKLLSESPKGTLSSATQQPSNLTTSPGRASGAVFHYEQIGHDAAIAKFSSPGTSLLYRLVKRLYERDTPKCVDFGEGEAEYKKALSNHITYTQSVLIVRNRLGWRVRFGLMQMARWMKGSVVMVTEKLGIRKRIAKYLKYRA